MLRVLSEGAGLFLLPFVAYTLLLLAQQRIPFVRESWTNQYLGRLAGAGLVFTIVGLLLLGLFGERHRGAYVPAHIDAGRLVPGHME